MISTKRFILKPLVEDDATERYLNWLDDADAKKYITFAEKTRCLSDLKQYVRDRIGREDILFLGIFEKNTRLHIGNIKYEPVNSESGYAIMGLLIGDPAYRGKGVAASPGGEHAHAWASWVRAWRS